MQRAGSPLDFIRNNLAVAEQNLKPQQISDAVALKKVNDEHRAANQTETRHPTQTNGVTERLPNAAIVKEEQPNGTAAGQEDFSFNYPEDENKQEDVKANPAGADELELEVPVDGKVPLTENYKKLKTVFKETKQLAKTLAEEKERLTRELEAFKTGEAIPEVVTQKEQRIAELERFEHLHNLEMSKEYQTGFIEPLNQRGAKLAEYARDYNIPEEVMHQALSITNKAELNQFISEHFDAVGGLEVKNIITEMQSIQSRAMEAKQKPKEVFAQLKEESQRISQQRDAERKSKIASTSKSAWVESINRIKSEGKVTELIARDDDPEFNRNFAYRIAANAGGEYGKIVKALADAGLDNLPKDVAVAISNMCLLAHASASAIESRNAAINHAEELERNVPRTSRLLRPPMGSSGGGDNAPVRQGPPQIPSAAEAARGLMDSVLSRKR